MNESRQLARRFSSTRIRKSFKRLRAERSGHGTGWFGPIRPARGATQVDQRLDYVSGGCLLARTSALRSVGLLDERFFMYGEDVDFGLRVRRAGFRLAYCASAEIWHRGGGTSGRR